MCADCKTQYKIVYSTQQLPTPQPFFSVAQVSSAQKAPANAAKCRPKYAIAKYLCRKRQPKCTKCQYIRQTNDVSMYMPDHGSICMSIQSNPIHMFAGCRGVCQCIMQKYVSKNICASDPSMHLSLKTCTCICFRTCWYTC